MFTEFPKAYGRVQLKTWGEWVDEYLQRSIQREGNLHEAIQRAERDGFVPLRTTAENNAVENVGFDLLLSFLGGSSATGIQYVALGVSNTAPTGVETQLPDEQIRTAVSSVSQSPLQLIVTGYFDPTQANVLLGSAALFGNGATATANSGTIYSYVVYNQFTKNNLESLTAQWTLGFSR